MLVALRDVSTSASESLPIIVVKDVLISLVAGAIGKVATGQDNTKSGSQELLLRMSFIAESSSSKLA